MNEFEFKWETLSTLDRVERKKGLRASPQSSRLWIARIDKRSIGLYPSCGHAQQALEHEWLKRNGHPEGAAHGGSRPVGEQ